MGRVTETTIRRINPDDAHLLKEVRIKALEKDPDAFGSTYDEALLRSDEDWADRARRGSNGTDEYIVLALNGDRPVGMAGGFTDDAPDDRILWGMWVSPEVRSQGIGRRLVESVVDWATDAGASAIRLWVVTTNSAARSLYRGAGFVETDLIQPLPSNPALDEVEMVLELV